ncbi:MAG: hypothetical protein ACI81T_002439 [Bacteroidia bacterium]|jgi:hypothetical protein
MSIHKILTFLITTVWFVNGLYCKVLDFVPRHREIVASILGEEYARELTILIGISEIVMAIWILSKFKSRLNAILQISIVGLMNLLEFMFVLDLLLWGKFNLLFAIGFMAIVYYNEFVLNPNPTENA